MLLFKTRIPLFILALVFLFSCQRDQNPNAMINVLLITGNDHPAHKWEETTPVIKSILESDSLSNVTVSNTPEVLAGISTEEYDLAVLNFCNWEDPDGLSDSAKTGFISYLEDGGGLIILHFSNGAFHFSLPGAGESDWPEYRKVVHQVWDHDAGSTHDPYGQFEVSMTANDHFITRGMEDFITQDELYYRQKCEEDLPPLFTAVSAQSGKSEPLGWAYTYKNARVFQTLLGHGPESYEPEEYREILKRATLWVSHHDK
jgi:type 1 glutamine amidotransferase